MMDPEGKTPFDHDTLEVPKNLRKEVPLSEKDFIQESRTSSPLPLWLWLFLATALISILWGSKDWINQFTQDVKKAEPFLQVTNRDFSLFLWQFPGLLRSNATQKTGYLPAFQPDRVAFDPKVGNEYVIAPPEVLFLYHTWDRLLGQIFFSTVISQDDFIEFLNQVPEWLPENWKEAPIEYQQWIASKGYKKEGQDLQNLSDSILPLSVKKAFQGWKNYFLDGQKVNDIKTTVGGVSALLKAHPEFARNYWRNISEIGSIHIAGLSYLSLLLHSMPPSETSMPNEELSSFLKLALYNSETANK